MGEIYYLCTHKSETGTALRATSPICFMRVFDKFALENVVWLFCGLVVLLFVQTYYLSLTTKLQATNPDNEKKL